MASVLQKECQKLKGWNWGVFAPPIGLGWKDHAYQSDAICVFPLVCLGEVEGVLSYCSINGWVINSDVYGLLDGPSGAMSLPAYNVEEVHTESMFHGLAVFVDWVGTLRCSLNLFSKVLPNSLMYSFSKCTWMHTRGTHFSITLVSMVLLPQPT